VLAFGPRHPTVAEALLGLGEAFVAARRPDLAVGQLERALAYLEPRRGDGLLRARTRFVLARALVAAGGDLGRARALAGAARASWLAMDGEHAPEVAEIDRWSDTIDRGAKP